jgi:AcrR family transcriptional regulator
MATENTPTVRDDLLDAARRCLRELGYSGLSTRRVAEMAGVPLSQIHYHFGSKQKLILALLEEENRRLLDRQRDLYSTDLPLWRQWRRACDYLEEDLESGYVRILQEMITTGWSDPEIAEAVRGQIRGWVELLTGVAEEAVRRLGGLGPLEPSEVATLVGGAFLGLEEVILLGFDEKTIPARGALYKIGEILRAAEEGG